jgi:hypothetical protein
VLQLVEHQAVFADGLDGDVHFLGIERESAAVGAHGVDDLARAAPWSFLSTASMRSCSQSRVSRSRFSQDSTLSWCSPSASARIASRRSKRGTRLRQRRRVVANQAQSIAAQAPPRLRAWPAWRPARASWRPARPRFRRVRAAGFASGVQSRFCRTSEVVSSSRFSSCSRADLGRRRLPVEFTEARRTRRVSRARSGARLQRVLFAHDPRRLAAAQLGELAFRVARALAPRGR